MGALKQWEIDMNDRNEWDYLDYIIAAREDAFTQHCEAVEKVHYHHNLEVVNDEMYCHDCKINILDTKLKGE